MNTKDWAGTFAERVEELRKARGWSQAELARRAGVSQSNIRDIETAAAGYTPSDKSVKGVARAFGVDGILLLRSIGRDGMADYLEASFDDPLADLTPAEREVALRIIKDIVELGRRSQANSE